MRSGSALLLVLLLGSLQLSSSAPQGPYYGGCCFKFTTVKKIPLRRVESYTETHSYCAVKAIKFHLKTKGKTFCVDPDTEWVKNHVAALDRRNTPTTAKPLTTNSPTLSTPAAAPVHDCCFNLTEMKIPLRIVESHTETHSVCPFKAFVLLSKKGNKFCADPDSELVAPLDQRNNTTTAKPSTTTNSTSIFNIKLFREDMQHRYAPAAGSVAYCCFNFLTMKIPLRMVESYTETHTYCRLKAIVLLSKSGKMFCGDPDAEWVKSLVAALDQRNTPTTAKPLTTNSPTLSTAKLFREAPAGAPVPDCCFKFTAVKRIPLRIVESFTETRSDCPFKAIVVLSKNGMRYCVHPDAHIHSRVKRHVTALD